MEGSILVHSSNEILQLTGLRALAALLVLALHLDQVHGNWLGGQLPLVAQGYLGVDIFFVLSGFILAHVYGLAPLQSWRSYGSFLWRRLGRIYPMHLATLLALIVMVASRDLLNTNFWEVSALPSQLFLLQAWVDKLTWNLPAWSISAEWAAYLAFPVTAAIMLYPSRAAAPVIVATLLLAGFQFYGIDAAGLSGSWAGWPAAWRVAAEFALGVLMFRIAGSIPSSGRSDFVAALAFPLIFVAPIEILKVALIGVFVGAVATSAGPLQRFLASRVVVWLGVISYSIYMLQFPAIKLIQNVNDKLGIDQGPLIVRAVSTCVWGALVIGIAHAAYQLIENPVRQWCRRQESRLFRNSAEDSSASKSGPLPASNAEATLGSLARPKNFRQ